VYTRSLIACILGGLLGVSSGAEEVRFTGETTADEQLIGDTLQQVVTIAQAKLACANLEGVVAEVMPRDFVPPDALSVTGSDTVTYERWTTTFCGKQVPFLITFWRDPQGGSLYSVGYPFPNAQDAT
jgi:hypothetical protein